MYEVQRWASVILVVVVVILGVYLHVGVDASNRAAAASNRSVVASDKAAAAASKASKDLAAAIEASNNPDLAAATFRALTQIDDILKILCIEHSLACQQVVGPGG